MKVAIVGAGLAGLACGCELAERGHQVTLIEKRPWAGGKAYSFADPETGESVDNGQHIFMRCTTAYVDFLRRLGTLHLTRIQERLRVPVVDADGKECVIAASALPSPMHLLPSFAGYAHLPLLERARVAQVIPTIARMDAEDREAQAGVTFTDWLRARGQSEETIREFWDLIIVPTLNCRSERASATQALFVVQEGFLASSDSAAVGLPVAGLSQLHVEPAIAYIRARGGEMRTRAAVSGIEADASGGVSLRFADGAGEQYDACVVALPPEQSYGVIPEEWRSRSPFDALPRFEASPIVNLHLWFDGPIVDDDFVAFTGCDLQWAFNRTRIEGRGGAEEHIVISLSAADRFIELEKHELVALLLPQLQRAFPVAGQRRLLRAVAIKEPDATFVPAPGLRRPGNTTPVRNVFVAGAYTDTGWPATMESAVRSGLGAAAVADAFARAQPPVAAVVA